MFRKIVLAHEGSPAGERALLYVEHLARRDDAEVVVVHIYDVPARYLSTDAYRDLRASFEKASWEVVDDAVQELQKADVTARGEVREGAAAHGILEVAEAESASLIVLGTRGPSSAAELLLGSTSTEVLRYARCPVLVVP
jgi:nucleotide-binding universal stress UspA family protein